MTSSKSSSKERPRDPYEVLGISRQADDRTVKQAYFRLVREFPPEHAPEQFQAIRAAYDELRTVERRAQTNLFLLQPPPPTPRRRRPPFTLSVQPADIVRLALEVALAELRPQEDFRDPTLPDG